MTEKKLYRCSCGYATHFEKALEAHCRFRHHEPLKDEPKQTEQPVKADEPKPVKATAKKTTRKPRTKKAVKE